MPKPCGHDEYAEGCKPCLLYRYSELYRAAAERPVPKVNRVAARARMTASGKPLPADGPGTELTLLLKSYGVEATTSCPCKAYARRMNAWGVVGCREHRQEIVDWLKTHREQSSWRTQLRAVLTGVFKAVTGGFVPDPRDVAGSLVDEAIRRAEAKASGGAS